eukprot:2832210-Pleurochrysis_carterae.AAC.1
MSCLLELLNGNVVYIIALLYWVQAMSRQGDRSLMVVGEEEDVMECLALGPEQRGNKNGPFLASAGTGVRRLQSRAARAVLEPRRARARRTAAQRRQTLDFAPIVCDDLGTTTEQYPGLPEGAQIAIILQFLTLIVEGDG